VETTVNIWLICLSKTVKRRIVMQILATLEGAKKKAYRAPLIVVGITSYKSHDKVPEIEQALATGGVLNNIGMAIYAHGFGSVWRTGGYASSSVVREGLGVASTEEIVGYLYIGTPANAR
jgi:nitroreductase